MAIDDTMKRVGAKVRHLRQAQNMSISWLADRSGVAKSTLTQIEGATSNPTLATLISLADALSCTLEDLILGSSDDEQMVIVRHGEGLDVSDESIEAHLVQSAIVGPSVIEFHAMRLKKGKSEVSATHGLGAREHVVVTQGRVVAGPISEQEQVLQAGDYASYRADISHRWTAVDGDARIWVITTYPRAVNV